MKYRGLGRRHWLPPRLLMRPQLNSGTFGQTNAMSHRGLLFGLSEEDLTVRSPKEREFLEALYLRARSAGWYGDAWPRSTCLTVSVVLDDQPTGAVRRTLRVDFDGFDIAVGDDPTHQMTEDWEISGPQDRIGAPFR